MIFVDPAGSGRLWCHNSRLSVLNRKENGGQKSVVVISSRFSPLVPEEYFLDPKTLIAPQGLL